MQEEYSTNEGQSRPNERGDGGRITLEEYVTSAQTLIEHEHEHRWHWMIKYKGDDKNGKQEYREYFEIDDKQPTDEGNSNTEVGKR